MPRAAHTRRVHSGSSRGADILVHNAAYKKLGKLGDVDEKQYDDHFDANVKTPLFMTQTAAKYLESGGSAYMHYVTYIDAEMS